MKLGPSLPPTNNLMGCDTYETYRWFKGNPSRKPLNYIYYSFLILIQRLQKPFRFDTIKHFRVKANSINMLQQPCLQVKSQDGEDSTHWMRTLNYVSRMVASSEFTLNLTYIYINCIPHCTTYFFTTATLFLHAQSHLHFDPTYTLEGCLLNCACVLDGLLRN